MLHPRDPPNPESQIPRYKFKLNQHLNLNLYREILRDLEFLDVVDFGSAALSVKTVIPLCRIYDFIRYNTIMPMMLYAYNVKWQVHWEWRQGV